MWGDLQGSLAGAPDDRIFVVTHCATITPIVIPSASEGPLLYHPTTHFAGGGTSSST